MKISASVYSSKVKKFEELVKELEGLGVDYIHIDCNDDLRVFDDIRLLRSISNLPVDLHIITSHPEKFYGQIEETAVELVSFQFENLVSKPAIPAHLKSKLGLALTAETPLEIFDNYSDRFSFVLFTSSTPGRTGDGFNKKNFKRIREFHSRYPGKSVHVDGGINDELSFVLRNLGTALVVSGSFLVNANYIGNALHNLRSDKFSQNILVNDFMLFPDELPVLKKASASIKDIVGSIEAFRLGFTLLVDEDHRLAGITSNADLRRGLIKRIENLNELGVEDVVNPKPFCVLQNSSVHEMLSQIKKQKFPILFLPVVDENRVLKGAVTFNNLIKGEA